MWSVLNFLFLAVSLEPLAAWTGALDFLSPPSGFMPHIHCYLGKPSLVWTMFVSDLLIGASYVVISLTLWALVRRIRLPFSMVVLCFGLFIGACGATHFMEVWTLWNPDYWASAAVKIVTAIASVGTGIYLFRLRHTIAQVAEDAQQAERRRQDLESLTVDLSHKLQQRTEEAEAIAARLRQVTDAVPVLISYVDKNLRYRSVNLEYEKWFGFSRQELLERMTFPEVVGSEAWEVLRPHVETVLSGKEVSFELEVPYQTAGIRHIEARYVPDFGPGGEVKGFILFAIDLSDRKHIEHALRESEQRFRQIVEASPFPVMIHAEDGEVVTLNRAWTEITGYRQSDVASIDRWAELAYGEDHLRLKAHIDALSYLSGVQHDGEYEVRTIDGSKRVWDFHSGPMGRDSKRRKLIFSTAVDVTDRRRAEDELQRSRAQLEATFQAMSDGVVLFDTQGRVVFTNEAQGRLHDFDGVEAKDHTLAFLTEIHVLTYPNGGVVPVSEWPISRVMRGESITNWELRVRRKDTGTELVYLFNGEPIHDESGKQILSMVISRDITDSKRASQALQESELRFRTYMEAMPQMAFIADREGSVTYFNRGFYDYVGKGEETRGWAWQSAEIHHPEDLARTIETWMESIRTGKLYQIEYRLRRHDGQYRWHLGRAIPLRDSDGNIVQWLGTNTDIHDQKETARRLEESLRTRDEFLSIASHELKTPLASLKLQSQLFSRAIRRGEMQTYLPERVNKLVDLAERQTTRLTRLVDDMLDIAHIRSGKMTMQMERVALSDLVRDVVERQKAEMVQAGTPPEAHVVEGIETLGDRLRIEQVLINLLTNAMRYGKKNPVSVHLDRSGTAARLSVTDHGMGIPKEAQARIFNRFERAVSANEVSGLGLGLFITRQIVEAHGGRVWVESKGAGEGSTFFVELPTVGRTGEGLDA